MCISIENVNLAALTAFLVSAFIAIYLKGRRDPTFPRWACGVPLLICFLLDEQGVLAAVLVVAPAVVRPHDAARCVASSLSRRPMSWCSSPGSGSSATYTGTMAFPKEWWFEWALAIRAGVLIWCLIAWVRDDIPPLRSLGRRSPAVDTLATAPEPA